MTSSHLTPTTKQPISHSTNSTQHNLGKTDIQTHEDAIGFATGTQDICIGVYNINTINAYKLEVTIKFMQKSHIGILLLILIDTRADRGAAKHLSAQARDLPGQGCYVASHLVESVAANNI